MSSENLAAVAAAPSSPGAQLRHAREARGESVHEVAFALKLSPRQVDALERDDFDALPGMAFFAPPQQPPPLRTGAVTAVTGTSAAALAGYPASSSAATALPVVQPSTVSITAEPTATDLTFTPGTAERALVTACTQCPQVMPSMLSVVVPMA